MLERFAYFVFVYPLSLLPLRVLYFFTDFFYLILRFVYPYRKKVVRSNIESCFPELTVVEQRKIEYQFYHHFTDLLAEAVKNLTISKMQLKKRINLVNRDYIDQLYIQGKSVLFVGAHYNNWEWLISAQNFLFAHQAVGIGMPMTSKFWDKKVNARRSRFGMKIAHAKNFEKVMQEIAPKPISLLVLSDQSPPNSEKSFWTTFMGKDTAVFFGAELTAHKHGFHVVYLHMNKVKRGYYELSFEPITEDIDSCEWGTITEKHVRILEKDLYADPSKWIWSHKRWKREKPANLEELKKKQRESFEAKFKSVV